MTTLRKSIIVFIERDGATINDVSIEASAPPAFFYGIFGTPDRIVDGSDIPAPVGYRNNQFHYFDALGVSLNEHHCTHQIQAINFVFETDLADHPTKLPFDGTLIVGGQRLCTGSLERQLANSNLLFTARLPDIWFATVSSQADAQPITVAVSTQGPKLRSGRRSTRRIVTSVSLCLSHDPWDTAHRPEMIP